MAKRKASHSKKSKGASKRKHAKKKGHIPLRVLEKRARKLVGIVRRRGGTVKA